MHWPSQKTAIVGLALVGVAAIAGMLAILLIDNAVAGPPPTCNRQLNDAEPTATPVDPPVTLTPTTQSAQRQLNFDADRDTKFIPRIVVIADPALKKDLTDKQLGFDAVLSRTGDTTESADFPPPRFRNLTIHSDRKTITFDACLSPGVNLGAGKYVGLIELNGPDGISPASIAVTVNLKDGDLFWAGLIFAMIVSFLLLLLKDAAIDYGKQGAAARWRTSLLVPIGDLRWWAATLVALGGAFGVLYAAFSADPAWGATGLAAAASLVASAFAAIGGQSILTSFSTPKS